MLTSLTSLRSPMRTGLIILLALGFFVGLVPAGLAQEQERSAEQQDSERWTDKALQFIDTIAEFVGKGIVYIVKTLMGGTLPPMVEAELKELKLPIGYLAVITITLILFGTMARLRKYIWWALIIAWLLIVIRIVLVGITPPEPTEGASEALMIQGSLACKGMWL